MCGKEGTTKIKDKDNSLMFHLVTLTLFHGSEVLIVVFFLADQQTGEKKQVLFLKPSTFRSEKLEKGDISLNDHKTM